MTADLQKAINELEHFSAILKNAKGLYASANELSDKRQEIRKKVHEIMQRIATNTSSAIIKYANEKSHSINVSLKTKDSWELYDKCSGEKLVDVLSNCLFLFHTVYDIRSIPHLFSLDEVREFDRINDAATQLLDQIGSNGLKKKLPKVVLEMFGQRTSNKEMNSAFAHKTFLFSTSKSLNTEEVDAKESAENFTESIEQLISKITANDFDIFEMRKLVEFDLTGKVDFALFKKACTVLPMVQSIVDFRVANEFLKVLKRIACSCKDWSAMMTYFYGEFREVNGDLKTFKQFYQNFDEDMKNLVNNLGDHAQLHTNQVKLEEAVDESAWLLMISPMDTIISLFLQCLENILMVPNLIRILRKLPKYCDIELEAVSEEDSSTRSKTPILMFALRHILTVERSSIQSDAKRRNFIYMCAALCRERYALLKDGKNEAEKEENDSSETSAALFGGILDFALVDGSLVLNYLVLPALKQMFYQEIAVEIGRKLLTTVGARRTPIIWRAEQGIKLTEAKIEKNSGVSILQLFSILLNIINENKDTGDYALVNSCEDCLRLLGERLNEDGVIIRTDAFDNLLICFDKSLWAYRYALASWFYKCLESYEREIPSLLYDALKEEKRQTLKAVKTAADDSDISGRSLLRKLFQLATIQPDLALDMINDGLSTAVSIAGYDISGALVDVIRDHDNFPNNKIGGLVEIIKVIANQIDLSRQTAPLLTEISESSFYGLRLIEPLLLIQEAVICAIYYDRKSTDDLSAVPFNVLETENQVALKLLKLFCELVKDHMQKEMIDLRRSHMKYKVEIKEPRSTLNNVNINREIRVETQLVQLYIAAVILANHITGLPSYLKILLVQLTNFHIEMGRMKLGPTFDEMTNKALLVQDAKEKTIDDKLSSEQLAAASDSDQQLTSPEVNDCSIRNSAGSNTECETNRMADIKNADVGGIRESAKDHLLETSGQNAIFMASTQMIKDRSVSAIIENHLRRSKPSNKRRSAAGPKPRRGALPPLSATDNIHNIHNGNEERYFDDRSYTGCGYNNDGSNGRNSGFRRKNKKHK
ncbi:Protein edg-1 [Dirofilaria immitis]